MSVSVLTITTPRITIRRRPVSARQTGPLLVFLLLVTLFKHCRPEMVFFRRDHRDQGTYGDQKRNSYRVQTYEDATKYLNKYGYLNCSSTSSKKNLEDDDVTSHRRKDGGDSSQLPVVRPSCTEYEIKEALRTLQETFSLRPTGRLDDDTRQTMSRGRCGNSDNEQQQQQQQQQQVVASNGSTGEHRIAVDKPRHGRWKNRPERQQRIGGRRKHKNGTKNGGRVARASARHIEHAIVEGESRGNRWSGMAYDGRRRRVSRSVIDPEEGVTGNPVDRRIQMLREITSRMKSGRSRNSTRVEQRIARWMTSRGSRAPVRRRKRRSVSAGLENQVVEEGPSHASRTRLVKEENKPVTWRLLANGVSGKIPLIEQKSAIQLSFRMWSEVIPLKFSENNEQELSSIDIAIAFGRESHWNCEKPFDGTGGELAHSLSAGDIHFDEDENYKKDGTGIDLLKVAVHEVGHVLGLMHKDRRTSIMYPIYVSPQTHEDFELVREDREAVQQIYGVCKGTFDVVFDWVRRVQDSNPYTSKYVFNTYFFRGGRYWMYENSFNRTRYGDPLNIEQQWSGLPSNIDAFTQVVIGSGYDFNIDTYFFKGEFYYKYSSQADSVIDGYPRLISQDFGSSANSSNAIPNDIDAVYFNNTDNLLYFFKGEWVWIYDPAQIGQNGCCVARQRFVDLYPTISDDPDDPEVLDGHISAVYYSYSVHTTYIFKGETVYEVVTSESTVSIRKISQWYNIWYDICEVD